MVLPDLILGLTAANDRGSVDDFWDAWNKGAESSLFRAIVGWGARCSWLSCHSSSGSFAYSQATTWWQGCWSMGASRLLRVSRGDEIDVSSAKYFVNSSLAPALLRRRRIKSIADVLKGIRQHGFSPSRWDALHRYWSAVCRQGPVLSLEPWVHWVPPDLHSFL